MKLVHSEEKTGRDELMLFSTKDRETAKFQMKKWLKENDQLEKHKQSVIKCCEIKRESPDIKEKEKIRKRKMSVYIPRDKTNHY